MRRPGFSLLELAVVLTVVGIVLAIGIPRLNATRNRAAARAATNDLAAVLSYARRLAVLRRAIVVVALDTARATVRVHAEGRVLARRALGSGYGVVLRANRDSIMYDPRGLGYGLANFTVTIRAGGTVDTLTMSRLGRVRW